MARLLRSRERAAVPLGRLVAVCFGALLASAPTATADDGTSINLQDRVTWPEGTATAVAPNLRQSPRSRLIYVSSSEGSDTNSGRTPLDPVRTLEAGFDRLRDGQPDWLLLKRGDVWHEQLANNWDKSGRSVSERMVVAPYGIGPRPRIVTPPGTAAIKATKVNSRGYIAFHGLHIEPATHSEADSGSFGVNWRGTGHDVLFQDLLIVGHKDNMILGAPNGYRSRDIEVQNCVILDSWSTTTHSQGIFAQRVDGLVIDGNVFDHNGWSSRIQDAEPTIYNHSMYIQADCGPAEIRNNIVLRTSSHGVQLRPGGVISGNFFATCPIAASIGAGNLAISLQSEGVSAVVSGNVVLDGRDLAPDTPRGMAFDFGDINEDGILIEGNLISNAEASMGNTRAIRMHEFDGVHVRKADVVSNIVLNWGESFFHEGESHGPILVSSNIFVSDRQPILRARHGTTAALAENLKFLDNVYVHGDADSRFFRERGAYRGVHDFALATRDASQLVHGDGASMVVTFEDVAVRHGFESAGALIEHLRSHGACSDDSCIRAADLIATARQLAFELLPTQAVAVHVDGSE